MATKQTTTEAPSRTMSLDGKLLAEAEAKKKKLVERYRNETRVPVALAPQYAAHFGNIMRVTINGISIAVPVDGSTQRLPKSYADEVIRRRRTVDKMLMKMKRLANVTQNAEQSPGSLQI